MKNTLFRTVLAIILLLAISIPLAACGGSTSGKNTPEDDGDGLTVITKDEFKALFTAVEITTENLLDYYEIKSDDKGYWLTPKENILSAIALDPGMQGFYCKITYTGEYEVQYKDESGNVTETATITTTQTVTSLSTDGKRIQLSPLVLKYTAPDTKTYDAPVKSITDITLTEKNQTPCSVCVAPDLTSYYNDVNGEKIVFVDGGMDGTITGYTASGKKTLPIAAEKVNGKWSFLAGDNITIEYDESLFAEGASLYGSFAYFKYLIESGYFA